MDASFSKVLSLQGVTLGQPGTKSQHILHHLLVLSVNLPKDISPKQHSRFQNVQLYVCSSGGQGQGWKNCPPTYREGKENPGLWQREL